MSDETPAPPRRSAPAPSGGGAADAASGPRPLAVADGLPELPSPEELRDLGFGTRVAQQNRERLLNTDGSFTVYRRGLSFLGAVDPLHRLLTMGWRRFVALSFGVFVAVNALFGTGYLLAGPDALWGVRASELSHRFQNAFFFSVETFTTVGYGHMAPGNLAAELLMTVETFCGLLLTALVTGLVFARFSRPQARIAFSRAALIAPYRGGTAFEFRMINERRSELTSLEVVVVLALLEEDRHGNKTRRFHNLALERSRVAFFPLAWTVVHPIVPDSPLWRLDTADLRAREGEFLVLVTAIDDALSQTTQTRTSYAQHEIVWGARFVDMFLPGEGGRLSVDIGRLHEIEATPLPVESVRASAG